MLHFAFSFFGIIALASPDPLAPDPLALNSVLTQFANYDLMIYKPKEMIEEIQSFMSLEDGDIIMSGTPKGVECYNIGDVFIGKIYSNNELLVEVKWEVEETKRLKV